MSVKGNQPKLRRAVFGAVQQELDSGHGRVIRRSLWVTMRCRLLLLPCFADDEAAFGGHATRGPAKRLHALNLRYSALMVS